MEHLILENIRLLVIVGSKSDLGWLNLGCDVDRIDLGGLKQVLLCTLFFMVCIGPNYLIIAGRIVSSVRREFG